MPHLVEGDHDLLSGDGGFGKLAGLGSDPVENRDIADAENASDGAKTHVAHRIKQQRQSLHLGRFAARGRWREIAPARLAMIALHLAHNPVLHIIRSAAALATNLRHGGLFLSCHQWGTIKMVKSILT